MSTSEELIFAFPADLTKDGVRLLKISADLHGTHINELFYRIEFVHQGRVESFRLPHDLDRLFSRLSTPAGSATASLDPTAPSTSSTDETSTSSLPASSSTMTTTPTSTEPI